MKTSKLVILEPELEALAGDWTPELRLRNARKFRRWFKQLEFSAYVLIASENRKPWVRQRLKRVEPKSIPLN